MIFLNFLKLLLFFFICCFFGIPFKVTEVTTKSYRGYYWTPKISKNGPKQHNKPFFAQRAKKKFIMLFWHIFGNFWCPVVTLITFRRNLSNFERYSKKPFFSNKSKKNSKHQKIQKSKQSQKIKINQKKNPQKNKQNHKKKTKKN